jgi:hypothetical protein
MACTKPIVATLAAALLTSLAVAANATAFPPANSVPSAPSRPPDLSAAPAPASEPELPANPTTTDSAASSNTPMNQITVEARRREIKKSVDTYVSNLTHAAAGARDDPLQRWKQPICLLVTGMSRPKVEFVLRRVSSAADTAGVPLVNDNRCKPNLYILFTTQPDALLRKWYHHDPSLYGFAGPAPVHDFVNTPRPIRIWYNYELDDTQGAPMDSGGTRFVSGMGMNFNNDPLNGAAAVQGFSSRLEYNAVQNFQSVVVVVDLDRVKGLDLGAIADYVAMASLTHVNVDADFSNSTTILRLFNRSGDPVPATLSTWDKSFLEALYNTRQEVRGQRTEIAGHMLNVMAR